MHVYELKMKDYLGVQGCSVDGVNVEVRRWRQEVRFQEDAP